MKQKRGNEKVIVRCSMVDYFNVEILERREMKMWWKEQVNMYKFWKDDQKNYENAAIPTYRVLDSYSRVAPDCVTIIPGLK